MLSTIAFEVFVDVAEVETKSVFIVFTKNLVDHDNYIKKNWKLEYSMSYGVYTA